MNWFKVWDVVVNVLFFGVMLWIMVLFLSFMLGWLVFMMPIVGTLLAAFIATSLCVSAAYKVGQHFDMRFGRKSPKE